MNRAIFIGLFFTCLCFAVALANAQAASMSFGDNVDVDGSVRLITPGSAYCFPDLTCMTSAIVADGSAIWGEITGILQNQTDLQNSLNAKEDKMNKGQANGYAPLNAQGRIPDEYTPNAVFSQTTVSVDGVTPAFHTQGAIWEQLTEFVYNFEKKKTDSWLEVNYMDNIGTVSNAWCNIGIFIDDMTFPICTGAWYGAVGVYMFQQQTLRCMVKDFELSPGVPYQIPPGVHSVKVMHRSNNCIYGNYYLDKYGANRAISIREL